MFIVYFSFCLCLFFMRTGSYGDPSRAWVTVVVVCISSWTLEKRENVILIKPQLTEIMLLNGGSQRLFSLHKCKEPGGISSFYCRMNVRVFGVGFSNEAHIGILGYAALSFIDKNSILVNPRDFWQMQFWEYRQNGHDKEGTLSILQTKFGVALYRVADSILPSYSLFFHFLSYSFLPF